MPRLHTKDKLARALTKAGLPAMAARAAQGYYHDYLSPLDFPATALRRDLQAAGTPAADALLARVLQGDFEATVEEVLAWAETPQAALALAEAPLGVRATAEALIGEAAKRRRP